MADNPTTLVTQEMIDRRDVWSEQVYSRPIERNDIIKWAIAVYWPDETAPGSTGTRSTRRRRGTGASSPRRTSTRSRGPFPGRRARSCRRTPASASA